MKAGDEPDEQAIADAYVYLLARMLVIRQEGIDASEEGFAYNKVKYNPLGSAEFVNPNLDVAYLECWIAVDDDSVVLLTVPEIQDRYYTAQILDEWGEVIININERRTPSRPHGTFALTRPGSSPSIPEGATRIDLHGSKAKLLARVELKDDPDEALRLQREFTVESLGEVSVAPPPSIPDFENASLLGVEIFETVDEVLESAIDVAPGAAEAQVGVRSVASFVAASEDNRSEVEALLRDKIVPGFLGSIFTETTPLVNGWVGGIETGNYGSDYLKRTVLDLAGIWANTSAEVVYFASTMEADGTPLDGSSSYLLHFPGEKLPEAVVDGYWSIILVGLPDLRVVPNEMERYNFNSHSDLAMEPDGSLKIGIGPTPVDGVPESNWLPSPRDKSYSLTIRLYVPRESVFDRGWVPPAVVRISRSS